MTENTKIQWTDHSASPWYGCAHKILPDGTPHQGCLNCYAEAGSKRNPSTLGIWGDDGTRVKSKSFFRNLRMWNKRAASTGEIVSVFPSWCDPFEDRPELDEFRREMFAAIDECQNVRLFLLTKRPENVRRMWKAVAIAVTTPDVNYTTTKWVTDPFPFRRNVWLLTSVSDQRTADLMIPDLLKCRDLVAVLGLSAEPLLGPIRLSPQLGLGWQCERCGGTGRQEAGCYSLTTKRYDAPAGVCDDCHGVGVLGRLLDWVIVGGESGHGARPCNVEWIRSIRDQCQAAGVPVFIKQLGQRPVSNQPVLPEWPDYVHWRADEDGQAFRLHGLKDSKGGEPAEWPGDLRVREFPEATP